MSNLQNFSLQIDLSDDLQREALLNLLSAMGGKSESAPKETKEEPDNKAKTTKKSTKKEAPKKKEPKKEEAKEEPNKEQEGSDVSLSDLRAKLGALIQSGGDDVREKCANKLSELGAKNLTTLDTAKYEDFMEFLTSL